MSEPLNDTSRVIGRLEEGLEALRRDHSEKARKDEEFRRAGYQAFEALEQIAKRQDHLSLRVDAHEKKFEQHDKRLDGHDRSRSWAKGVIAAVGVIGSIIGTGAGLLLQLFTGKG